LKNGFKYLTSGEEDIRWRLFLNVAGLAIILPGEEYPSATHPSGYYFYWDEGRILNEFQINYITSGSGILENRHGTFPLREGSVFITFPGEWHRYRPNPKSGWTENYIGFDGSIARQLFDNAFFSPQQPVVQIGIREEVLDSFLKIFDLIESEQPGFQQIVSGYIMKLLGNLVAFEKQKGFSGKRIAKIIEEARFLMRQNYSGDMDFEAFAHSKNVGYSYFRKMFRKFTGVSPGQYLIEMRMMRAKEMLVSTDSTVSEIGFELGFQSIYYFSYLFKEKVGMTPSQYRNKNKV
jgi:AraC-like DNA-binding protein